MKRAAFLPLQSGRERGFLLSDNVIVGGRRVHQVGQRNAGKVVFRQLVIVLPHGQRATFRRAAARRGALLKTGDRREAALRHAQDLPKGVLIRLAREPVASADAVRAVDEAGGLERGHEPLDIFERDALPVGHLAHGNVVAAAVLGQIEQYANGIAALR